MSADQSAPMDSTKSRPTERTGPGRENIAGGAMRNSQPHRSSVMSSRARASPPADPTVKDTEHSSRVSPEKTNNCTANTRRPNEETRGINKREAEKEFRETRDSKPRRGQGSDLLRAIEDHLDTHRHQRRGDPQEEDTNGDRMRQNDRSTQRTNSSQPSSNHPDKRQGDPQEHRNDDKVRQNDRSNPQRTSHSHPDSYQKRGDPQVEGKDDGRMQRNDSLDPQLTNNSSTDSHSLDHGGGDPQEDNGEDGGRNEEGERRENEGRRPSGSRARHSSNYRGRHSQYRNRPSDSHRQHGRGYRLDSDQIRTLMDEKSEQAAAIDELKAQLARAQGERNQSDQLLKERTAELSTAQAFLGKADSISVTEVSKMVESLNSEVQQVSAHIADSLTQRKGSKDDPTDHAELERALNEVKPYIGPRLQSGLLVDITDKNVCFDQTLSQIVLQAGLINACARVIGEWNPPAWESRSNVEDIYNSIRSSGEHCQTV